MIELSLRPYNGRLFYCKTKKEYERETERLFSKPDVIGCACEARFSGGEGVDGQWTYMVYAKTAPLLAHELSHVLFHVFERCGMDPRDSGGEAFCYMLGQLMMEA